MRASQNARVHLPSLPSLQDFIKMYRLDAKKAMSQNYLMDMNLARKIVRRAGGTLTNAMVLEIGPGPGGITRAILERPCRRLDVVEIDKRFLPPLQIMQEKDPAGRLFIHNEDIKKTNVGQIWTEAGLEKVPWISESLPSASIIGNLPFNISTYLITRFMKQISERSGPWSFGRVPLTLTFQSEVAHRIVGEIGSNFRSRLSVMVQYVSEPQLMFEIPGKNFVPAPEVDVGVVRFIPRQEPLIPVAFPVVEKLVRQAFHLKNKYVFKGLRTLYPPEISLDMALELLKKCGMNPKITCVQIGVEEFADMSRVYFQQCQKYPGLFLYEYNRPKRTLDTLKDEPNPFPPKYTFSKEDIWRDGVSLSNYDNHFGT